MPKLRAQIIAASSAARRFHAGARFCAERDQARPRLSHPLSVRDREQARRSSRPRPSVRTTRKSCGRSLDDRDAFASSRGSESSPTLGGVAVGTRSAARGGVRPRFPFENGASTSGYRTTLPLLRSSHAKPRTVGRMWRTRGTTRAGTHPSSSRAAGKIGQDLQRAVNGVRADRGQRVSSCGEPRGGLPSRQGVRAAWALLRSGVQKLHAFQRRVWGH